MQDDSYHRPPGQDASEPSIARRREILRRIGKTSLLAGAAASPMAALAGTGRPWCKHPLDSTKCVQASISGMGSTLMSAQASNEVCSKKVSHYASYSNWPSSCTNGSQSITCNSANDTNNTDFCIVFGCTSWTVKDSNGVQRCNSSGVPNASCLLNKSLPDLCANYATSPEAHWSTALGNANKLAVPTTGAPFPYTPGQVVAHFNSTDLTFRSSAYTFYSSYCETYA